MDFVFNSVEYFFDHFFVDCKHRHTSAPHTFSFFRLYFKLFDYKKGLFAREEKSLEAPPSLPFSIISKLSNPNANSRILATL